jgi:hypothetical protein
MLRRFIVFSDLVDERATTRAERAGAGCGCRRQPRSEKTSISQIEIAPTGGTSAANY